MSESTFFQWKYQLLRYVFDQRFMLFFTACLPSFHTLKGYDSYFYYSFLLLKLGCTVEQKLLLLSKTVVTTLYMPRIVKVSRVTNRDWALKRPEKWKSSIYLEEKQSSLAWLFIFCHALGKNSVSTLLPWFQEAYEFNRAFARLFGELNKEYHFFVQCGVVIFYI